MCVCVSVCVFDCVCVCVCDCVRVLTRLSGGWEAEGPCGELHQDCEDGRLPPEARLHGDGLGRALGTNGGGRIKTYQRKPIHTHPQI